MSIENEIDSNQCQNCYKFLPLLFICNCKKVYLLLLRFLIALKNVRKKI